MLCIVCSDWLVAIPESALLGVVIPAKPYFMEAFMSANYPPFAVFPDLHCILRTPSGAEYRGKLRQHPSTEADGEVWYEGYMRAEHKDHVTADTTLRDRFNRDGLRPAYFHPDSNVEPLRIKLNRIPLAKRTDRNADTLVGEVWTHEGLWTVVSSPSDSDKLHLAGNVVPSRHELAFDGSRIKQYQPQGAAAEAVVDEVPPARKGRAGKPASRPA